MTTHLTPVLAGNPAAEPANIFRIHTTGLHSAKCTISIFFFFAFFFFNFLFFVYTGLLPSRCDTCVLAAASAAGALYSPYRMNYNNGGEIFLWKSFFVPRAWRATKDSSIRLASLTKRLRSGGVIDAMNSALSRRSAKCARWKRKRTGENKRVEDIEVENEVVWLRRAAEGFLNFMRQDGSRLGKMGRIDSTMMRHESFMYLFRLAGLRGFERGIYIWNFWEKKGGVNGSSRRSWHQDLECCLCIVIYYIWYILSESEDCNVPILTE